MSEVKYAYTGTKSSFPEFVNITENDDGSATIKVRQVRSSLISEMTLPKSEFAALCEALGSKPVKTSRVKAKNTTSPIPPETAATGE